MAKSRYVQTSFLSGELSPLVSGNVDLNQYYQGAETASNVLVVPQGGLKRRGGLGYIGTTRPIIEYVAPSSVSMPNGGSTANISDSNDGTLSTTTTGIGDLSISSYVIAQYTFTSAEAFEFVDIMLSELVVGSLSGEFKYAIQSSTDNIVWTNTAAIDIDVEFSPFNKRVDLRGNAAALYWRVIITGAADLGTSTIRIAGLNFYRGVSGSPSEEKLIGFEVTSETSFFLAITDGNIDIYDSSSGAEPSLIYSLPSGYLSAETKNIRSTDTENVCLLYHEEHPVKRIIYHDENAPVIYFLIDDAPFTNIPTFDFNDDLSPTPVSDVQVATFNTFTRGQRYQIDVEGVISKGITFAGDSTVAEQQSTEENMQKMLQEMPIFGESGVNVTRTGVAQYTITVSGESAKNFRVYAGFPISGSATSTITFTKSANGAPRKESVWSSTRGYPRIGAFFQGRLWLGGTRDKRQSLMASKSGSLLDFTIDQGDDDEGIFTTIVSKSLTEITDIYAGRNLLVFTVGSEYAILDDVITPSSVNMRAQTSNGSLYLSVQETDGAVVFADSNGKTLREYVYTFNEDSYSANDITVLSSHLIASPVEMAFLNGTTSDDANWLFVVNADGTAAVLNKLRSQDINAFTSMSLSSQFATPSKISGVTVVNDQAFFTVKRYNAAGDQVSTIERFDFNRLMDGSVKGAATGSVLTGLSHLVGFQVSVVGDSSVLPPRTVDANGEITLTATELATYSSFEAGLNFTPTIKPMPISTNIGSGTNFMRLKKVVRMNIRVNNSFGLHVDGVAIPFRSFGADLLDEAPTGFSGILEDIYPIDGWGLSVTPVITCPDPTPLHVQAVEFEVESS